MATRKSFHSSRARAFIASQAKARGFLGVSYSKGLGDSITLLQRMTIGLFQSDGTPVSSDTLNNYYRIASEGRSALLNSFFQESKQSLRARWIASNFFTSLDVNDTLASHAGWRTPDQVGTTTSYFTAVADPFQVSPTNFGFPDFSDTFHEYGTSLEDETLTLSFTARTPLFERTNSDLTNRLPPYGIYITMGNALFSTAIRDSVDSVDITGSMPAVDEPGFYYVEVNYELDLVIA